MGVGLYYDVERAHPLSPVEEAAVAAVLGRYDLDRYTRGQHGGEPFSFYEHPEPGYVLEGVTNLPLDRRGIRALRHWCRLLTDVRAVIEGGTWHVHLDDDDIDWDEGRQTFVPEEAEPRRWWVPTPFNS